LPESTFKKSATPERAPEPAGNGALAPADSARAILDACLAGERWSEPLLRGLVEQAGSSDGSRVLFGLAESLSDRFEPALVDCYAAIFAEAIAAAAPQYKVAELLARYGRVRRPRQFDGREPQTVYVLSRVTLGADIAVTSVMLDAAKRRFPKARIVFCGSRKSFELFAGDRRIEHMLVAYGGGGGLRERLLACPRLDAAGVIVIDPDSRLTQLGLVPICPEENYYFFESRSYGADGGDSLARLAGRWASETFGVDAARPYAAPLPVDLPFAGAPVAVSFGVGGNAAKRVRDPFEQLLLAEIVKRGFEVVIDTGPGGEEAERVERAVAAVRSAIPNARIETWRGSFAAFLNVIARSRLYVGYDSAGQHAAAALGIPVISVFAGFPCERFLARWRPTGSAPVQVVRADSGDPAAVLAQCRWPVDD
jgi:hypothetical protein